MSSEPSVVLVTGASSGIGRAAALEAARKGDELVLVARGKNSLEDTAEECDAAGAASVMVVPADVGDDQAVARCVEQVLARHARIDVAINSAGVVAHGRMEEVPAQIFDGVIRTNLLGAANLARHVLPVMRRQGRGTLVFVGSIVGHVAIPTLSAYVISKWGVRALVRQLRLENREIPQLQIAYVAPGGVDTPIYPHAANYVGFAGRTPPPGASSRHTAKQLLRRVEHPRLPSQLSLLNYPIVWGSAAAPWALDRVLGAIFPLGATDLTQPVPPQEGNVLTTGDCGNRLDGGAGSSIVGVGKNVLTRLRARARP